MRVYHFLNSKHALDDLRNRRLKIALYSELNDPFELIATDNSDPLQRQILAGWKNDLQSKSGLLCFSRSWRNPVLWSHYADKHKGMCLGFDINDEYLIPVKYSKSRMKIDLVELKESGKLNEELLLRIMRTKYVDWSYEREVRVPVDLNEIDKTTGLYFYNFSGAMRLAEIIAGALCAISEETIVEATHDEDCPITPIKARLAFQKFHIVKNKQGFSR